MTDYEKTKERINKILCDVACCDGHINDIIDTEIRPLVDKISMLESLKFVTPKHNHVCAQCGAITSYANGAGDHKIDKYNKQEAWEEIVDDAFRVNK